MKRYITAARYQNSSSSYIIINDANFYCNAINPYLVVSMMLKSKLVKMSILTWLSHWWRLAPLQRRIGPLQIALAGIGRENP